MSRKYNKIEKEINSMGNTLKPQELKRKIQLRCNFKSHTPYTYSLYSLKTNLK